MSGKQRLSRAMIKEIKDAFKSGLSRSEIAQATSTPYATVCYHLPNAFKHKKKKAAVKKVTVKPAKQVNWKAKYLQAVSILAENGLV